MLKIATILTTLTLAKAYSMPDYYRTSAVARGVSPDKLYAVALANAGVTTKFGHYLPWSWSVTIDGNYYQFKTRIELFQFLKTQLGNGKKITYGIAGIPLKFESPNAIWDKLSIESNLDYIAAKLKKINCDNLAKCIADYRSNRTTHPVIRLTPGKHKAPKHRANTRLNQIIAVVSRETGIEQALIHAIIARESAYKQYAKSHAGAMGYMQLMPGTARYLGLSQREFYDPYKNIKAGTRYIKEQLVNFDGRLDLALAAYNAGPGNVRKYKGIPPYKETRKYVPIVMRYYRYFKEKMG